jgi:hypothetical protein
MCGQYGLFGTNAFNVLLDMDKLQDMKQYVKEDRAVTIERALGADSESGVCAMDKIRIDGDIRGIRPSGPLSGPLSGPFSGPFSGNGVVEDGESDNYNIGF